MTLALDSAKLGAIKDSILQFPLFEIRISEVLASMETELIPCTICGHEISKAAASCPNCGHPRDQGLFAKVEKVQKIGGFIAILISLLVLGLQATALKLIGLSNAAPGAPEVSLTTVFLQTAPFTIAVTIIALVLKKEESSRGVWEGFVLAAIVLGASVYLNAWLTGKELGVSFFGNPFVVVLNTLLFYWKLYGASLFLSSIALGGFLAWAIDHLWPRGANKNS
ncbi:MAG: hypothetical protein ABL984_03445 [Pyrinomonadaceae bacterium]